jgi:uncharacterized protein with NAD-binding domain and iron-sulfur cluster
VTDTLKSLQHLILTVTQVAVLGGGIGGLTAAQELAERGFEVTVYEANDRVGGKARSVPTGVGLQGEHGFRFFPAFYRHVVDTMERIPDGDGTVADNLVETEEVMVAFGDEPPQVQETTAPDSVREWVGALRPAFAEDLPNSDMRFLVERMLYLLTACEQRREAELDQVSWWEFVDAEGRSQEFRDRLAYLTQSLVALRPRLGSARTVGTIYLQLLFGQLDPTQPTERILNGPTSEVWIDPWMRYLDDRGVRFELATPVTDLAFDGRRVTAAQLPDGAAQADEFVLAVPVETVPDVVGPDLRRADPALGRVTELDTAWMNGIQFYLAEDVELVRGHQVYADTPWALTAISQRQFWSGYDFEAAAPDDIEGVLSVIASDWDTPGVVYGKPARECTRAEIADEVWAQVKSHLDGQRLDDDLLVDWYLDQSLVETDDGVENRSPLLINTVGSLENRPPADLDIDNLTLAADYVRTNSDLASMESANEAGRRAANAIIDRHRGGHRATVWELEEPSVFDPFKRQDRLRYRLGLPHPAEVTRSVRSFTRSVVGT